MSLLQSLTKNALGQLVALFKDGKTTVFGAKQIAGIYADTNFAATNTVYDIAQITLQPGSWLVFGNVTWVRNSSTGVSFRGGIGTVAGNNFTGVDSGTAQRFDFEFASGVAHDVIQARATKLVTLTTPTIFYLKAYAQFSAGTPRYAGEIYAAQIG